VGDLTRKPPGYIRYPGKVQMKYNFDGISIHKFACLFYLVYLLFICVFVCFPNKWNEKCSVNFFTELHHFTLPLELTWVGLLDFLHCTLRSVVNHVIVWDRTTLNPETIFVNQSAEWPLRSGSLNSVVAVFSGGFVIVFNVCNLEFRS